MEKVTLLGARKYYLLSCGRRTFSIKGHKEYEEVLVITLTNDGGYIELEIVDKSNNESTKLENPESGIYSFPLKKGEVTNLIIRAKSAIGSYKIEKKTTINK